MFTTKEATLKADADNIYDNLRVTVTGVTVTDKVKTVVTLLYRVGVGAKEEKSVRIAKIKEYLLEKPFQRMCALIQENWDDNKLSEASLRWESWKGWQLKLLQYLSMQGVSSIFGSELAHIFPLMYRQKLGNCYLHPALAVIAYKSHFDMETSNQDRFRASTLDSNRVVRSFNEKMLYKLIVANEGGDTIGLLKILLNDQRHLRYVSMKFSGTADDFKFIQTHLETCGPGLITGFEVIRDDIFHGRVSDVIVAGEILQFDTDGSTKESHGKMKLPEESEDIQKTFKRICDENEIPDTEGNADRGAHAETLLRQSDSDDSMGQHATPHNEGTHAMVLIGCRNDEAGKLWYLIQNTWRSIILFEVSEMFLYRRLKGDQAGITFLMGSPCVIPTDFKTLAPDRSVNVDSDLDSYEDMTINYSPVDISKM